MSNVPPLVRVGLPMIGIVVVGHYALTNVLQGRIHVRRKARTAHDSNHAVVSASIRHASIIP